MALEFGMPIKAAAVDKHLVDADNVKGGFCVVATTSDRDNLPAAYGVTDGIITKGSLVYCQTPSELYVCTGVELVGSKPTATWTKFVSGGDVNPMVFIGTLGNDATISTLPDTSSANKGNVYKVKTEGTYTYNTNMSVTVKVGDTLISNETEWVVIPSGDEPTYQSLSELQNSSDVSLVTRGEKYDWNHSFLPLSGGRLSGSIKRSAGGQWIQGRSNAVIFGDGSTSNAWNTVWSQKTTDGAWTAGCLGGENVLRFVYDTDTNFNAGNNTSTYTISFPLQTGTVALTSDLSAYAKINVDGSGYSKILKPDGSENWIKANAGFGFIPSQSGGASSGHDNIGTTGWYWANAYIQNIYSTGGNRVPVVQTASSVPSSMTTGVLYLISG